MEFLKGISDNEYSFDESTKVDSPKVSPLFISKKLLSRKKKYVGLLYPPLEIQDKRITFKETMKLILDLPKKERNAIFQEFIGIFSIPKSEINRAPGHIISQYNIKFGDLPETIYYIMVPRGIAVQKRLEKLLRGKKIKRLGDFPPKSLELIGAAGQLYNRLIHNHLYAPDFHFANLIYYRNPKKPKLIDYYDLESQFVLHEFDCLTHSSAFVVKKIIDSIEKIVSRDFPQPLKREIANIFRYGYEKG